MLAAGAFVVNLDMRSIVPLLPSLAEDLGACLRDRWKGATALLLLLGLGWTGAHSDLQARSAEILPSARGFAIAVFACGLFMGGSVGTALVGAGIDRAGYQPMLLALAAAMLGFTVLGWFGLRRTTA